MNVKYVASSEIGYSKPGDAGIDLPSSEDLVLKGGEQALVGTSVRVAIDEGYVGLVWDRSGLAAKHGITTMAGVIDSGYRGEIKVVLRNMSSEDFEITKGMRICQLLIQPVVQAKLTKVESLDETHRGDTGFGSTGHN